MAAPKGNKNALGNTGGGRKSAYQERADAETLHRMFFAEHDYNELKSIVKSGKFSVKDQFLLKALEGDSKAMAAIFKKLFPDKMELDDTSDFTPLDESDCPRCRSIHEQIEKAYAPLREKMHVENSS
ncbi:MAG TPA: hypothetical protein VEC17_02950 [Candidatus Binatia bacterium]|nr:hypothetical protein [Candidatus Binatia bacterium]